MFVTAGCLQGQNQTDDTSIFCPGYTESLVTPYAGEKTTKLETMATLFCARCSITDTVCNQLFCGTSPLMVTMATAMLSRFCNELKILYPGCHSEYCSNSVRKRDVQTTTKPDSASKCYPAPDWSDVSGMDQWCTDNCVNGINDAKCPASYCSCVQSGPTEADNVDGQCVSWEASPTYSSVEGMDEWCHQSCNLGGSCPASHCTCGLSSGPSTTITTTTQAATTTGDRSTTTDSATTTSSSTPSTTSTSPSMTATTSPQATTTSKDKTTTYEPSSTATPTPRNYTDEDTEALLSGVMCDVATAQDQNILAAKYCKHDGDLSETGYGENIVDYVLTFAPKFLCSFAEQSRASVQCPNMFCGEDALSQSMIRAGMCDLCTSVPSLGPACTQAYC